MNKLEHPIMKLEQAITSCEINLYMWEKSKDDVFKSIGIKKAKDEIIQLQTAIDILKDY